MTEPQAKRIGERIRQLRQRRGLTQKELVGERMTRNMLSLIENGTALPSLPSLVYLAETLEVPVDYFLSPTEEERFLKLSIIEDLRQAFGAERYNECLARLLIFPASAVDDEIAWIGVQAHLHTALDFAGEFELRSATQSLKNAQELSTKSVYVGEDIKKALAFYREFFTLLPSVLEFPERLTDLRLASTWIPVEMLLYLGALRVAAKGGLSGKEFPKESHAARHMQALAAISANRTDTAVRLLRELTQDGTLPYFMRYRVYSDLEEAAGATGEYRIAYMAARKKLDLLETAKK